MSTDRIKLRARFGSKFPLYQFEDIEDSLLKPNHLSVNYQKMLESWAPMPAAPFKDHNIQMSDWSAEYLTIAQVLYAAFDVVALQVVNYNLRVMIAQKRATMLCAPFTTVGSNHKCSITPPEQKSGKRPQNSISIRYASGEVKTLSPSKRNEISMLK
jgi:hypothetical protein